MFGWENIAQQNVTDNVNLASFNRETCLLSFLGWQEKEKEETKSGSKVVLSSTLGFNSFNSLFCYSQPSLQSC